MTSEDSKGKSSYYGTVLPQTNKCNEIQVECVYIPVISHMDITNNTVELKVDVDLSWAATLEDVKKYNADPIEFIPEFAPNIVFPNCFRVDTDELIPLQANVRYQIREGSRIFIRHRFIGTLSVAYDVSSFPFDVQNIPIVFCVSFYDKDQLIFKVPADKNIVWVTKRYTNIPGFEFVRTLSDTIEIETFSHVVTIVQAKRTPGPYFFRIGLPLWSLNAATFSMYALSSIEEVINVLITVMLAFVGMVYVLSTLVPLAGKKTLFDAYAMVSMILCVIAMFMSSLQLPFGYEKVPLYFHIVLSVILHFHFSMRISRAIAKEKKKETMCFEELSQFMTIENLIDKAYNREMVEC
eukprot:CAMPEP_0176483734 /NCGR_PEP_ID=MMETSP0200_2-20121128/4078_1 /TAXON_ID=947934 /ORGANISM="Chaetoceros sp., Strain GSL56" /LENGTH=351 /DNA_ID=CAMNT_0017880159 /DNA_START=96 /DNA_END=1151 /DNA_ORIENTATION=-